MAKRIQKAASAVNQARNSIRTVENWGNTAIGRTPGRRCKVTWLTGSDPRPTCWLDLSACSFMKSISIVDVRVFPCSPINLTLAVLQHFHGISRGLTVPRIIVLGKAPDNVAKFVKQNGDSSLRCVAIIKTYLQPVPSRTHASC
jgi:hypothetical protein